MKISKIILIALLFQIVFLLYNCAGRPFKFYSGPRISKVKVACLYWGEKCDHIRLEKSKSYYFFTVKKINGSRIGNERKNKIELLPGEYKLIIECTLIWKGAYSGTYLSDSEYTVTFNAEAGHIYKVDGSVYGFAPPYNWRADVSDITDD